MIFSMSKKLVSSLLIAASLAASFGVEIPFADAAYVPTGATQSNQKGQNFLTYSEQFDNAVWVKSAVTVTANTTETADPTGGFTADKVVETAVTAVHQQYIAGPATNGFGTYTYSIYVKNNTRQYVVIYIAKSAGPAQMTVDLTTGAITDTRGTGYVSSKVTPVGNGWYRCSLTVNFFSGTFDDVQFMLNNTTGDFASYLGDVSKSIYVWGAQLVKGPSPGAYNRVAASNFNSTYTPAGAAQSNQKGQNYWPYSQKWNTFPWQASGATVTENYGTAPNGTKTSNYVHFNAGTTYIYNGAQVALLPVGQPYTMSAWLRSTTSTAIVRLWGEGAGSTNSGDITLTPTWTRYSFTVPSHIAGGSGGLITDAAGDSVNFEGWGFQLEVGRHVTAYNPTLASALNTSYIPAGAKQSNQKGQNLLLWSEQFQQASWAKNTGVTVTADSHDVQDPKGGFTADKVVYDGSGVASSYRLYEGGTFGTVGLKYTQSVWLRTATTTVSLFLGDNQATGATFMVTTSWQRFQLTSAPWVSGAAVNQLLIYSPGVTPFTVYAWGAQREVNSYAHAYNPTTSATIAP